MNAGGDRGERLIDKIWRYGLDAIFSAMLKSAKAAGGIAMLLLVLVSVVHAVLKPDYNWDMLAYVGTALENRFTDASSLHAETWRQVSSIVPESALNGLKFSDEYRQAQWESPANFQSQLTMYRVKAGYIEMLRLIEPVAGLVKGGLLLSILASVLFIVFIVGVLVRFDMLQAGVVLTPALLLAGFARMGSMISPDIVLAAVSIAAIFALLREKDWLASGLLTFSVVVRPDNIIMVFALLIAAVLFGWRKTPLLIAFAASIVAGLLISRASGHPGWWAHFYFTCIEQQHSMTGFHPDFSLRQMLGGYARGAILSVYGESWPSMLALMLIGWGALAKAKCAEIPRLHGLIFAVAIGVVGKFTYFPMPDDRFYFNMIASMALLLALLWCSRFKLQ